MKKSILFSALSLVAGMLLVVLPKTVAKPCPHEGRCVYSTKAVLALGIVLAVLGITGFVAEGKKERISYHILGLVLAVEVYLIPAVLIGGCEMKSMACRKKTFPVFFAVAAAYALLTIISLALTAFKKEETGTSGRN